MYLKDKILEIIKIAESKHRNDPSITQEMDQLTILMLQNVNETIELLESLEMEELGWLCSDFEELSYKFQSKAFVECLKRLDQKFPRKMSYEIQNGIEAYYGDDENEIK
ncbi:MAG: hypothetical protein QM535_04825 [Limnohabitans sp.]|nr:hypothetical protein [Limnohabitans sp.]